MAPPYYNLREHNSRKIMSLAIMMLVALLGLCYAPVRRAPSS